MLLSELIASPLTLVLLALCAGLLFTLTVLLVVQRRRYRNNLTLPDANGLMMVDHAGWHPDRRAELEDNLATLTQQHVHLQEAHTLLLARHKTLIRAFQQMQQERPTHPLPVALRKVEPQAKTG